MSDAGLLGEWLKLVGYTVFDGFVDEDDIAEKFKADRSQVTGVVAALYGGASYEGDAFVLLVHDGKLFEVNGTHCSCHGLEEMWELEETSVAALRKRQSWPDSLSPNTYVRMSSLLDMLSALEKKQ